MIKHAIQPGETSGSIARRYGITQQALFDANPQLVKARDRSGHLDFALAHFRIGGVINVPAAQSTPSVVRPNANMVAPWVTATWDTPFSSHATYAQHYAGVLRLQLAKWGVVGTNVMQELNDLATWLKYAFRTPAEMFRFARKFVPLVSQALASDSNSTAAGEGIPNLSYAIGALWANSNGSFARRTFLLKPDATEVLCTVEGKYTVQCIPYAGGTIQRT